MITITIKSDAPLSRTTFRDLADLRAGLLTEEVREVVVLEEIAESTLSSAMRKKIAMVRTMREDEFLNM